MVSVAVAARPTAEDVHLQPCVSGRRSQPAPALLPSSVIVTAEGKWQNKMKCAHICALPLCFIENRSRCETSRRLPTLPVWWPSLDPGLFFQSTQSITLMFPPPRRVAHHKARICRFIVALSARRTITAAILNAQLQRSALEPTGPAAAAPLAQVLECTMFGPEPLDREMLD